jgi:hypothetical protein
MKAFRLQSGDAKTEVPFSKEALSQLVDTCLDAAFPLVNEGKEPPEDAWIEISDEQIRIWIGMRSDDSNFVSIAEKTPYYTGKKVTGFWNVLKALLFSKPRLRNNVTSDIPYEQVLEFIDIVLTGDVAEMYAFVKRFMVFED